MGEGEEKKGWKGGKRVEEDDGVRGECDRGDDPVRGAGGGPAGAGWSAGDRVEAVDGRGGRDRGGDRGDVVDVERGEEGRDLRFWILDCRLWIEGQNSPQNAQRITKEEKESEIGDWPCRPAAAGWAGPT